MTRNHCFLLAVLSALATASCGNLVYHVEGALVRELVGKDLKRNFQLDGAHLVMLPASEQEHWRAEWQRKSGAGNEGEKP